MSLGSKSPIEDRFLERIYSGGGPPKDGSQDDETPQQVVMVETFMPHYQGVFISGDLQRTPMALILKP